MVSFSTMIFHIQLLLKFFITIITKLSYFLKLIFILVIIWMDVKKLNPLSLLNFFNILVLTKTKSNMLQHAKCNIWYMEVFHVFSFCQTELVLYNTKYKKTVDFSVKLNAYSVLPVNGSFKRRTDWKQKISSLL